MTAREWKPGDVAMVRLDPETEIRVMFNGANWFGRKGTFYDLHASARPLVVIDPEDREAVERLIGAMRRKGWTGLDDDAPDDMAAALREFANPTPPRPEEPTGLGAVVEDERGRRWVRSGDSPLHDNWRGVGSDDWTPYADITAVRVLSEGVTQ